MGEVLKYLNLTIITLMLLISCQESHVVIEPAKPIFIDTLSFRIEKEISLLRDSIWKNDSSATKVALLNRAFDDILSNQRNPDRLDTLEMKLDSTSIRYKKLYYHDSTSFTPRYDILPTITKEQFHKIYFYSYICELLGFNSAAVYKIETPVISDTLIIKKLSLGWMQGKGITDGTIEVYFKSDSILLN